VYVHVYKQTILI